MTLTLLLDLDDTLLGNEMDTFLPAYLQGLSGHLAKYVDPDQMVASLLDATRLMTENQDPDCTLEEVFDEAFYPAIRIKKSAIRPVFDSFYEEKFPSLQGLTQFRPEAVRMVDAALSRGYQIAIATNPLFPRSASLQRVAWAGFDLANYPFKLVSTYENFHFSKPNSAYYAEVLATMNWPEGPVLMVGDDLNRDILPAQQMGLSTFWIKTPEQTPTADVHPTGQGLLEDLLPWLDDQPEEVLQPDWKSPDALMATLLSTPAALDSLCRNLSAESWLKRPIRDQWCATEILCHMRDVEREVNLPRVRAVMNEFNPFIPGKDTDPWADQRQYIQQDGPQAFRSFIQARLHLLDLLRECSPDIWERPARHAILGPTDLAEIIGIIAEHDRLHIRQVRKDVPPGHTLM